MMKTFPAVAHLIHSRLQIVRLQLNRFNLHGDPRKFIASNKRYFDRAVDSVITSGFQVAQEDIESAALLFLYAMEMEKAVEYFVIVETDYVARKTRLVDTPDGGITLIAANPNTRWSNPQASEIKMSMHVNRGSAWRHLHLERRWALPDD